MSIGILVFVRFTARCCAKLGGEIPTFSGIVLRALSRVLASAGVIEELAVYGGAARCVWALLFVSPSMLRSPRNHRPRSYKSNARQMTVMATRMNP